MQPTLTNQFGDSSGEPTRHWQPYCGEATLRPAPPSVPRHMCVRVGSWPSKLMRCGWGCAGGAVCTRRGQNRVQGGQRVWLYDSVGCSHVRSFLAVREHWHVAACVLTATARVLTPQNMGILLRQRAERGVPEEEAHAVPSECIAKPTFVVFQQRQGSPLLAASQLQPGVCTLLPRK